MAQAGSQTVRLRFRGSLRLESNPGPFLAKWSWGPGEFDLILTPVLTFTRDHLTILAEGVSYSGWGTLARVQWMPPVSVKASPYPPNTDRVAQACCESRTWGRYCQLGSLSAT